MAKITKEMKELVQRMRLCFVATADSEGKPNLSPKGSIVVLDDEHLAFCDIDSPNTIRNLRNNPHIEINVVDPVLRKGYRFKGWAELLHKGPIYDQVAGGFWEREGKQYPVNTVVKIKVETAMPVLSPAYTFNSGISEDQVREVWIERYGYGG